MIIFEIQKLMIARSNKSWRSQASLKDSLETRHKYERKILKIWSFVGYLNLTLTTVFKLIEAVRDVFTGLYSLDRWNNFKITLSASISYVNSISLM